MANDAVRRIMAEVKEFATLNTQPTSFFHAAPLESDLFEWHFSVRGPPDTPFAAGVYHGRILLPAEYPLKPPEIILLTPNGRFEVGKRICLSVTAHHQETWQPSWGIRTIITALVGFMPSKAEGVGALDYPDDDRRGLARKSLHFKCPRCGVRPVEQLPPRQLEKGSASAAAGDREGGANSREEPGGRDDSQIDADEKEGGEEGVVEEVTAVGNGEGTPANVQTEAVDVADSSSGLDKDAKIMAGGGEGGVGPDATGADVDVITPREAVVPASRGRDAGGVETERRVTSAVREDRTKVEEEKPEVQEKELLYAAYAIVFLMVAVVVRRVVNMITS